jgi:actin-related protein 5
MSVQDASNPQLYHFADEQATPDPYLTQEYTTTHKGKGTPIIIDNGSSYCRMGWAGDEKPAIVFRNAVARSRGKRGESDQVCVGNDIASVEVVRSSLRTQFDRCLVSNYSVQEQLLDYGFAHLGLHRQSAVRHPVVITEPVCDPGYCRGQMSELLFEAYDVPAVAYGVDALFGAHRGSVEQLGRPLEEGLVVSCGHCTCHILPVLQGRLDATHCKRINLGGFNVVAYLNRLLQLSRPPLLPHLTLTRAQEMVHANCYLATDYSAELQEWGSGSRAGDVRLAQLPYSPSLATPLLMDAAGREARDRQRRERAREQLLKVNQRKREEKIAEFEEELERLLAVQTEREQLDAEEYSLLLEQAGFPTHEALLSATREVQSSLETEQQRLASLLQKLNAPDLGSEAVSEEWLQSLRERQKELLEQRRQRRAARQELGKRRSAASQNRMRIISQLAEEAVVKRSKRSKEDTFGMNDDDWNVYRAISRDTGGSDSEREDIELADIKKVLDKHDPGYMRAQALPTGEVGGGGSVASLYQLPLGIERFR